MLRRNFLHTARATLLAFVGHLHFALSVDVPSLAAASDTNKKKNQDPVLKGLPVTELTVDEAMLHALNRLAYGPRPGDMERVRQMGLAKWIEQQLNPKSIDDQRSGSAVERLSNPEDEDVGVIGGVSETKTGGKARGTSNARAGTGASGAEARRMKRSPRWLREMDAGGGSSNDAAENNGSVMVAAATPDAPSPMKLNPATRGAGGKKDVLGTDPNAVPRAISDDSKRPQRVVEELAMAKMTRAIYSERQLQQVMDDFWFNHFNVFAGKGEVKWYLTSYERDVIQPHALGKFKDLVTATAKSPAMLFYLDNFLSADPKAAQRQAAERAMRHRCGAVLTVTRRGRKHNRRRTRNRSAA